MLLGGAKPDAARTVSGTTATGKAKAAAKEGKAKAAAKEGACFL